MRDVNEAEQHWQETVSEIDEALEHAFAAELSMKTAAQRAAVTRLIQRLNVQRRRIMRHHPVNPAVACACRRESCTIGPAVFVAAS